MPLILPQSRVRLDADADAARILSDAARAVDAVLCRRASLDRAGLGDMPLMVASGENHGIVTHHVQLELMLDGLRARESIAFCYEEPHDQLGQEFQAETGRRAGPAGSWLRARDKEGDLSLKAVLGFCHYKQADHSRAGLFRFLLRNRVPTRFTDVAKKNPTFDLRDASTVTSFMACFKRASDGVATRSPQGVYIRNHHMAAMGKAFARATGARIVVQHCGNSHVAGDRNRRFDAAQSLSAMYKALDLPVMGIVRFHQQFSPHMLPGDYGLNAEERLFMSGLPQIKSAYGRQGRLPGDYDSLLQDREDEAAYRDAVLRAMGRDAHKMSVEDYRQQKNECAASMRALFAQCPPPRAGI